MDDDRPASEAMVAMLVVGSSASRRAPVRRTVDRLREASALMTASSYTKWHLTDITTQRDVYSGSKCYSREVVSYVVALRCDRFGRRPSGRRAARHGPPRPIDEEEK